VLRAPTPCPYRYNHPPQAEVPGGSRSAAGDALNSAGLPLRPGVRDCPHLSRTGHCKHGARCWFNHPEPAGAPGAADAGEGRLSTWVDLGATEARLWKEVLHALLTYSAVFPVGSCTALGAPAAGSALQLDLQDGWSAEGGDGLMDAPPLNTVEGGAACLADTLFLSPVRPCLSGVVGNGGVGGAPLVQPDAALLLDWVVDGLWQPDRGPQVGGWVGG
jgi:hypothetical protein